MPRSHHARRTIALAMLWVWLFALACGVANACVLEVRTLHGHARDVTAAGEALSAAVEAGSHVGDGHEGAVTEHAKASCLKACDDGAQSVPKQERDETSDAGPAAFFVVHWPPPGLPIAHSMVRTRTAALSPPDIPIRARFSRLAL